MNMEKLLRMQKLKFFTNNYDKWLILKYIIKSMMITFFIIISISCSTCLMRKNFKTKIDLVEINFTSYDEIRTYLISRGYFEIKVAPVTLIDDLYSLVYAEPYGNPDSIFINILIDDFIEGVGVRFKSKPHDPNICIFYSYHDETSCKTYYFIKINYMLDYVNITKFGMRNQKNMSDIKYRCYKLFY